jgi:hypothetical protein
MLQRIVSLMAMAVLGFETERFSKEHLGRRSATGDQPFSGSSEG